MWSKVSILLLALYVTYSHQHCDSNSSHTDSSCTNHRYRSYDGSCNNLYHREWGAAGTTYARLLPNRYADGVHSPPVSVTGNSLPSSRLVSTTVFCTKDAPDPNYTIVMMQFGQFVAHDMGSRVDADESCCKGGKIVSNEQKCFPIQVPSDDPIHAHTGTECMSFARTLTDRDNELDENKSNQPAEQINVVTDFLDLSLIYGNSEKQAHSIRSFSGGRFAMDVRDGKEWPLHDPEAAKHCFLETQDDVCYTGGDDRLNQSPDLAILHIFYIREHNRLADILHELNPHWSDEKIYQEARRINIAQFQYVTYYEWLPLFLGERNMKDAKMIYHKSGDEYVNDYNSSVNPSVFNAHAGSAFRYYHSEIEGTLNLMSESRETLKSIKMSEVINKPKIVEVDDNYDSFARGMATQAFQKADKNFDVEVKEFLFNHLRKYGDDIRAIDIQRGRDHGIAGYNSFRELCGLGRAEKWDDFLDLIPPEDVDQLKLIYESFDDVDLSVGGILERHLDSALTGPTYYCIFMRQFYNSRVGDRYWFENGDPEFSFTRAQLAEIRKSSIARMFCDNGNNITNIQPNAFHTISETNKVVKCTEIPAVDYNLWKEEK